MTPNKAMPYNVEINSSSNGRYIVRIGCETFVFTEDETTPMLDELYKYLKNPKETVLKWYEDQSKLGQPELEPVCVPDPVEATRGIAGGNIRTTSPEEMAQRIQSDMETESR